MAEQDEWARLTLRLPPKVLSAAKKLASANGRSMNAEIVYLVESGARRLASGVTEELSKYDVSSGALPFSRNLLIAVEAEVDTLLSKSPKKISAEQRAELVCYIYEQMAAADPDFIKSAGNTELPINKEIASRVVRLVTG